MIPDRHTAPERYRAKETIREGTQASMKNTDGDTEAKSDKETIETTSKFRKPRDTDDQWRVKLLKMLLLLTMTMTTIAGKSYYPLATVGS